jgi:hypothetical protein
MKLRGKLGLPVAIGVVALSGTLVLIGGLLMFAAIAGRS